MADWSALRIKEPTKDRVDEAIPEDKTRDQFVNALLDQYEDGENSDSTSSPGVSNEDLRSEISALSDKIDSIKGRSRQY